MTKITTDAQVGIAMLTHHRALQSGKMPSEAWRLALDAARLASTSPAPGGDNTAALSALLNLQPLAHRNDATRLWQMFEDFAAADEAVSDALRTKGASPQPVVENVNG